MISQETTTKVRAKLEYSVCPLCGSGRRDLPFRLSDPYSIARCTTCGFHYLYPRLIESAMQEAYRQSSYYEGGTSGYADTSYTAQESALRATFKRLMVNLARRGLTGGDLLEIGCGYGYLLDEARSFFDERVGTDFSPQAADIARTTGADVFIGGIDQIPPERKFDCVVATQVIEHVYEPLSFVRGLAERTKPGGHIVIATPDIGGVLRKVMGRRWPSLKAPEHVLYFDFRRLSALMQRAGLTNVRRLPHPHAFPVGLIAAKFGLIMPPLLARLSVWVPATTVAASGRVDNA
ncbi:MAG TPA: class I SAM-dependent methyltransferase [Candidatus Udaeobacter sp.]|nr:class I SAM-dependent methyltransferase [Candidatus Udaeobacter sp.]